MKKIFLIGFAAIFAVSASLMIAETAAVTPGCIYSITAAPDTINFGPQTVGTNSGAQAITITNTSDNEFGTCSPLTISLSIIDVQASQFEIESEDCVDLALGATCTANILFSPDEEGGILATFKVTTSGSASVSDTTGLSGTGTAPASSGATALLLSALGGDDSDGCNASASTGVTGRRSSGPAAMGLVALMGLVLGTAAVRRRMKKRG